MPEYEQTFTGNRAEVATQLRVLADALDADDPFTLGDVGAVDPPDEIGVEVEVDAEDGAVDVELELEWTGDPRPDAASAEFDGLATTEPVESLARFECYRDRADEWRWRLVHRNGNIIADSGEGYTTRHNAEKGLKSVQRNAPGAEVIVLK